MQTLYVASRASLPARVESWHQLRAAGVKIRARWIDHAAAAVKADAARFAQLWREAGEDMAQSDALLMYAEKEDFPLRGVFVEAGMALALGKPIHIVLPDITLEGSSLRPLGAWAHHPLVKIYTNMDEALADLGYESVKFQKS